MLKTRLLAATALVAVTSLAPVAAFAQTPATPTATDVKPNDQAGIDSRSDTNADGSAKSTDGEVVVTGSRIRRPTTFTNPDPVTVITSQERTEAGFNNTTSVLQSTAVTNGAGQITNIFGGFVTNGGPGANTLSLRGLGTARSLILLNGRRLAPSGSRGSVGSADLNTLPTAVVDRVEVLNSGSSSIYGSDAVAGVVNIITRNKVKGLEFNAQVNVPERGAGIETRLAGLFGASGERFDVVGSVEYYRRNEFAYRDRADFRCVTDQRLTGAGAPEDSGSPIDARTGKPKCYGLSAGVGAQGVTVNTIGTPNFAGNTVALAPGVPAGYGTLPTSAGFGTIAQQVCNRFRPNPSVTTGALPGYECVGGGFLSTDIRDTFPLSILDTPIVSPTRNYNGYLSASYKVGALGDAELYGELLATRRQSNQIGNRQLSIDYAQGSPLLPANLRNGTFLAYSAAGTPGAVVGVPVALRVFSNYGNYYNNQTADFVKGVIGLRGNLPGQFHYDAYVSKSWSDATYAVENILQDRIVQSMDAVASGNGFVCRNPVGGCVAAPALTNDVIAGIVPAAWRNFITAPNIGNTKFRETIYNATIDGPLFALPGGDAQLVLGAEYRRQFLHDQPSNDSIRGNLLNFTSATPTVGGDNVWEVYGETELPIIHDSFIKDLTVTGSARYTRYASYGGGTTYKIGANLAPTSWLRFRGSYGTSYRAPALFEQYLGTTSGFNAATTDICNNLNANTAPVLLKNCQADGIPLGFVATQGVSVLQRGGAASGLKAEKSRNINGGVVFQPRFSFGDFSLAVDYFDIKVRDGVSLLTSANIQGQCYNDVNFRANAICNFVQRSPTAPFGLTVITGYVNISNTVANGIDFTARFNTDAIGPGRLSIGGAVTDFIKRYTQTLPTDPIVNLIGTLNQPKWTGTFDASYTIDQWKVRYGLDWIGSTDSDAFVGGAGPTFDFHANDYFAHSLSAVYRAKTFEFSFGVRNLTDKAPEKISSGAYTRIGNYALYSGYDFVGRTYFMNVATKF